jgi:predicted kinase
MSTQEHEGQSPLTKTFAEEDQLWAVPRMVIMVGFSRTGKSTYVNQLVQIMARNHKVPFAIISGDDVRRTMGVRYDSRLEDQVKATVAQVANALMVRRQHVIIDETNLSRADRQRWIDLAAYHGYAWTVVEIECLDEDRHQKECARHQYPWKVIQAQKARYQPVEDKCQDRYTLIKKEAE